MNTYKNKFLVEDFTFNSNEIKTSSQNFFGKLIEINKSKNSVLKQIIQNLSIEDFKLVLLTNMGICVEIIDTSDYKALTEALNKFHSKLIYLTIYNFPEAALKDNLKSENVIIITVNFIDNIKENLNEFNFHKKEEVRLPLVFYLEKKDLNIDYLISSLLERISNSSSKFHDIKDLEQNLYIIESNEDALVKKTKYTSINVVNLNEVSLMKFKNKKVLRIIYETKFYRIDK